jgi:hypothetical protein
MAMTEDFVEVNFQPVDSDTGFGIELRVKDANLAPEPFTLLIGFQLGEGEIPGLNDDVVRDPEQVIDLAKGLLLCEIEELPQLATLEEEYCPPKHKGFYYDVDIEMEVGTEEQSNAEEQQWRVSIFQPPLPKLIPEKDLFVMIRDFFKTNL